MKSSTNQKTRLNTQNFLFRKKHKLVKEQHPDLDIRFVFSNPKSRIGKKSQTTYGMWCERFGFKYATGEVPLEWTKENAKKIY